MNEKKKILKSTIRIDVECQRTNQFRATKWNSDEWFRLESHSNLIDYHLSFSEQSFYEDIFYSEISKRISETIWKPSKKKKKRSKQTKR